MGTRAMIRIDGKDFAATHWDGYPEGLGKDLAALPTKSKAAILTVAKEHSIDAVDKGVYEKVNKERVEMLSKKHKLPISKIKKGIRRGNVIASEDYEIGSIDNYSDFVEYIYDIKGDSIYVAKGHGDYDATRAAEIAGKLEWKEYLGGAGAGVLITPSIKSKSGWKFEGARHALARKGIKTGQKKKTLILHNKLGKVEVTYNPKTKEVFNISGR